MPTKSQETEGQAAPGVAKISESERAERRARHAALVSGDDKAVLPTGETIEQARAASDRDARIYKLRQIVATAKARGVRPNAKAVAQLAELEQGDTDRAAPAAPSETKPAEVAAPPKAGATEQNQGALNATESTGTGEQPSAASSAPSSSGQPGVGTQQPIRRPGK